MLGRRHPAQVQPRMIAADRRSPRHPIPVACDLAIAFRPPRTRAGRCRLGVRRLRRGADGACLKVFSVESCIYRIAAMRHS
jgi:hypothetical protein